MKGPSGRSCDGTEKEAERARRPSATERYGRQAKGTVSTLSYTENRPMGTFSPARCRSGVFSGVLFCLVLKDFIYLFMRDPERGGWAETQAD